jgi:hypothetical protein
MACSSKRCVVKKTIRVVCSDDCNSKFKPKKKKKKVNKRVNKRARVIRKIVRIKCPPTNVNVTTPPPTVQVTVPEPTVNITVPEPTVNITVPEPTVNITVPEPTINITTPPAIVHVHSEEDACVKELRAQLKRFIGDVISVIVEGGSGTGGQPTNRIGTLETVGKGTFMIRPTLDNTESDQVAIYAICKIIGFRPMVAVPNLDPVFDPQA